MFRLLAGSPSSRPCRSTRGDTRYWAPSQCRDGERLGPVHPNLCALGADSLTLRLQMHTISRGARLRRTGPWLQRAPLIDQKHAGPRPLRRLRRFAPSVRQPRQATVHSAKLCVHRLGEPPALRRSRLPRLLATMHSAQRFVLLPAPVISQLRRRRHKSTCTTDCGRHCTKPVALCRS